MKAADINRTLHPHRVQVRIRTLHPLTRTAAVTITTAIAIAIVVDTVPAVAAMVVAARAVQADTEVAHTVLETETEMVEEIAADLARATIKDTNQRTSLGLRLDSQAVVSLHLTGKLFRCPNSKRISIAKHLPLPS
jgi:2-methylaconitate cis-trans-isomerase PrpF